MPVPGQRASARACTLVLAAALAATTPALHAQESTRIVAATIFPDSASVERALDVPDEIEAADAALVGNRLETFIAASPWRQRETRGQFVQWDAVGRRHMIERHPGAQTADLRPAGFVGRTQQEK